MSAILAVYLAITAACFLIPAMTVWDMKDDTLPEHVRRRTREARWALAAPLWPITFAVLVVVGLWRLIRMAVGR